MTTTQSTIIQSFFAPDAPETIAHSHVNDYGSSWDSGPALDEALVAGFSAFASITRYVGGSDLVIYPSTRRDLESVLRSFVHNEIHNAIARSRSPLRLGGYGRVCHLAEASIRNVLNTGDNTFLLLGLHSSQNGSNNLKPSQTIQR